MELKKLCNRYIMELQRKNPATISNLHRIVGYFVNIEALQEPRCVDYVISRRQDGAQPATINREITIMKQFCAWLTRQGILRENPAKNIKYEKLNAPRTRWLTVDEELRLLAVSPEWLKRIIIVATSTGLRRGELLGLKWEHVKQQQRILVVVDSKNGEPRVVPLTNRAMSVLTGPPLSPNHVFFGISPHTLEYFFKKATKEAGLDGLHFHDLRHTFATRLIQGGADIYAVQRLLGHKNPAMTHRYSHHSVESLRKAIEFSNPLQPTIPTA